MWIGAKRQGGRPANSAAQPSAADTDRQAQYQKLKAAADALMDAGELDVYSLAKEDLERGAALFKPAVRFLALLWSMLLKLGHNCMLLLNLPDLIHARPIQAVLRPGVLHTIPGG